MKTTLRAVTAVAALALAAPRLAQQHIWYGDYDVTTAGGLSGSGGGGDGSATQATLFARFYLF